MTAPDRAGPPVLVSCYNCQAPQFQLEQPDTTTNEYNWTIGGSGSVYAYSDNGIYDTLGSMVSPHSLYLERLQERLGGAAVKNIGYPLFTISSSPASQTLTGHQCGVHRGDGRSGPDG